MIGTRSSSWMMPWRLMRRTASVFVLVSFLLGSAASVAAEA